MARRGGVRDIDRGRIRIREQLKVLSGRVAKVGFQLDEQAYEQEPDGFKFVAQIAAVHEFGTSIVPRRPFMSTAFDENLQKLKQNKQALFNRVIEGRIDGQQALALIGQIHEDQMKRTLTKGPWKPLSDRTIAARKAKHSSQKHVKVTPLIDTGQMRQSIRYVVVDKDA